MANGFKLWYLLYKGFHKTCLPFKFLYALVEVFLWDMYWYKGIVPKKYGRPYTPTPLNHRLSHAWYTAKYGEE